jgi:dinuclear metal center YbgI/SA1388 family protein
MPVMLGKVFDIIDEVAPFSLAEKWDNSGLQVGSRDMEINKILIALDPTMEALEKAISLNARLIITHHPLLFNSISRIDFNQFPGNIIQVAIKNDVAIIAAHSNLDNARMGINHFLAGRLELTDWEVLEPKELNGIKGYGLGVIGCIDEPIDLRSYTMKVKNSLGTTSVKVIGADDSKVKRVAAVGGAGRDYIAKAKEKGADLIITGDIGHHDALNARALGVNVIDAGHFYTERVALTGFMEQLKERFMILGLDVKLELYKDETDPVRIM